MSNHSKIWIRKILEISQNKIFTFQIQQETQRLVKLSRESLRKIERIESLRRNWVSIILPNLT